MSDMTPDAHIARARIALKERAALVETFLEKLYKDEAIPGALATAARYSLLAGGKRIRPVLCLTCARLCGLAPQKAMPFAAARFFSLSSAHSVMTLRSRSCAASTLPLFAPPGDCENAM